jgi:hypothetical protein
MCSSQALSSRWKQRERLFFVKAAAAAPSEGSMGSVDYCMPILQKFQTKTTQHAPAMPLSIIAGSSGGRWCGSSSVDTLFRPCSLPAALLE